MACDVFRLLDGTGVGYFGDMNQPGHVQVMAASDLRLHMAYSLPSGSLHTMEWSPNRWVLSMGTDRSTGIEQRERERRVNLA